MSILIGLVGRQIAASKSPDIFQAISGLVGKKIGVRLFDIEREELPATIHRLREDAFVGCSVTIPYKTYVIPYLSSLDRSASQIKAVNSIQIRNGYANGFNTDRFGFDTLLLQAGAPDSRRALVLGAGGAARAAVAVLLGRKTDVTIASRSVSQFQELADLFSGEEERLQHLAWASSFVSDEYDLIVNTTPLGGASQPTAECPIQFDPSPGVYLDLNYNRHNKWIEEAKRNGWISHDGALMLVAQAVKSFEIWTGGKVEVKPVFEAVFAP